MNSIDPKKMPEVRFIASMDYAMFSASSVYGGMYLLAGCLMKIARNLCTEKEQVEELNAIEKSDINQIIEKSDINQIYDAFGLGGSYEIKTQVVGVGSAVSEMFTAPVDMEKHTGLCVILDREALLYVSTAEQILKWNRNCGVHLLLASYGNGKITINGEEKLSLVMTGAAFYPGSNGIARK